MTSIQDLCKLYNFDYATVYANFKQFKIYVLNHESKETIPTTLNNVVRFVADVSKKIEIKSTLKLYCNLGAAICHAMWIERMNSGAGNATDGKMHEKTSITISHGLNMFYNDPPLSLYDIRPPAYKYTVELSREASVKPTTKTQSAYQHIFSEAKEKIESDRKATTKDKRDKARQFFNIHD